jgi:hypothetical protein
VTMVNPGLRNASIVKDFVVSKRATFKNALTIEERRAAHPLKKDPLWSIMKPKPIEFKSLNRKPPKKRVVVVNVKTVRRETFF